ncbi:MAG: hypothetical protein HKO92_08380 [Flavobacteriaceae bacterium]|nr:hypothetical protein [Flavobacteriaceae bacterium]
MPMDNLSNVYNNGEIIITHDSCLCNNSGKCTQNVSKIIGTSLSTLNDKNGSKSRLMIEHIKRCPSGALKYHEVKKVS